MPNLSPATSLRTLLASAFIGIASLAAGCASIQAPANLADTIAKTRSLSTLSGLLRSAGLTDTLQAAGPFTVFAPSNEAFQALPAKTLKDLGEHPDQLKALLTYHVIPGKAMAADIHNGKVKSLNGAELELSKAANFVVVDTADVGSADINASNGVVHIIDSVLKPPVKK
jgi:uncharacterized surface protein with fasciclin (FAS1) repeats